MNPNFTNELDTLKRNHEKETEEKHKKMGIEDVGENGKDFADDSKGSKAVNEIFNLLVFGAISLIPLGLVTLLSPTWNWSLYTTVLFWVDYMTVQFVSWYVRVWVFNNSMRKLMEKSPIYKNHEKNIQDFVDKDFQTPFIDTYADKDRQERKIRAFKRKIKLELIKLNNKYHINNLSQHFKLTSNGSKRAEKPFEMKSDIKYHNKLANHLWANKQLKINDKINSLFDKLTDEWIENNIDTVKVKYSEVSKTILVSGHTPSQTVNDEANYDPETFKVFMKFTLPTVVFISAMMFLLYPLIGSGLSDDISAWGIFFTKVLLVASGGVMIAINKRQLFKATHIKAMSERNSTLNKYYKDFTKKKEEVAIS